MKNLLSLLLVLLLISLKLEAQVTKTVDLVTPGTLSTLLSSTEKSTITNLIITGNLNAQDFKCLRDEVSELAVLDLSNTLIKAYNGTSGTHPGVSAYPDNQLPQYSFFTYTGISKDKLVQINLPNSITSIGNHSFYSCKGLTSITIPNTVTSIGDYAFQQCSAMKSITLGSGLQTIGAQSIYKTGLKVINSLSVVPPTLGPKALAENYISIVYVPSTSVSSYQSATGWQSLPISTDELVSVNNATAGALAATINSSGYQLSSISKLKVSGYLNSSDFEQIKNNMPLIMELDFTDASIQGNAIPANAFYGKNILTTVKLPSIIESIGDNAFASCSNLADIFPLPSSLKTIGSSSFSNCYSLTGNLVIPNTVTSIGNYAFNGCKGFNGNLILSDNLTSIPIGAFGGCTFLKGILNIPNSVTAIGTSAFFDCNKINELVIGNNCSSIGDEAFQRATSLSKITIFNPNPPTISASSFNEVPKSQVSVYVPLQSVGLYKTNTNWSAFPNINPISANGTFSITLQVLAGGSVSVNSVNQSNGSILYVEKDSTVTFAITPNVGYEVATILYDGIDVMSQVTNGTFTTPALTANTTLSVSFRKITYKIHLSVSGGGVLKENSTILTDGTELIADKNSVRTFTVLPDEGYEIDTLFFGGVDVKTRLTGNQFITDPIVSNDTLKIAFKSSTVMYGIHVINGGNGKVLLGNDVLKNDTILNVKVNATRTFSLIPDTGYEIATLMYQGSDVKSQLINNQLTIPAVTADGVLSITFRKLSFEITIEVNSGGQILENAINLSNGTKLTADYNSTKTFVIVPSTDYEIATVTYGDLDVKSQLSNNQFTTPAISSNKTLSVTFKKISFKIKIFKGSGGQLIENSINLADGASVEAEKNTKKVFTINPADGFELATLTYNGENVKSQVVNNKYTTPSVISNDTLSVTFRQIVKIKQFGITFLIGNGGTITSGNLLITNNSILDMDSASVRTFTFVPEAGLEVATLTYGGKDVKSNLINNQFTIPPITSNSTLNVTFRLITPTYKIAINIGTGGSIKENNQLLENNSFIEALENSVKTFTIIPDEGFILSSIKYGGVDQMSKVNNNTFTTPIIDSNTTLSVTFRKIQFALTIKSAVSGVINLMYDYGSTPSFSIIPSDGWKINTVTYNDSDITTNNTEGMYLLSPLKANGTLIISFENLTASPVVQISNVKVYSKNSEIIIEGVSENELVNVYTVNGTKVYNQNSVDERTVIPVRPDAVYLVNVAGKTYKVIL